jgi:hypothetical protein
MSHKIAKAIRKELKETGFKPTAVGTEEINRRTKTFNIPGSDRKVTYETSTIRHKAGTARRTYQDLK